MIILPFNQDPDHLKQVAIPMTTSTVLQPLDQHPIRDAFDFVNKSWDNLTTEQLTAVGKIMEKRFEKKFQLCPAHLLFIKLIYTNNKIKINLFKGPNVQISLIFLQTHMS